jgi:trehalose/maltose transport system substrate-binding protein
VKIAVKLGSLLMFLGLNAWGQSSTRPVTVTFLDIELDTPDLQPGLAQDIQEFTRQTGIQVKRLGGPDESLRQLAMWRELLRKGTGTPDVYGIDVIWPGMLSQYFMDLKPYFATELSSEYPVVVSSYTVGDKLVAMPRHAYLGVLLYRRDLLQRYGYRDPPKTWDQLEAMATRIQAGERATGKKDFWGYVWQGAEGEDLTCNGLEWQVVEGGGRIIEDNRTIGVNNPRVIRAWQRAARWVGSISPPSMVAYQKWDAANLFASGRAAFFRWWESDYSLTHWTPLPGDIGGTVGVTSVPGSEAGRASTLGGNGLAVSRASAHPREAIEMIRFLLSRDVQSRAAREHSEPPGQLELYQLPAILEPYPAIARLTQHGGGVVVRPSNVAGQKYEAVSRAYARALNSVLLHEKDPSVAAAALEKELIEITGFKTGPPPKRDWWSRQ